MKKKEKPLKTALQLYADTLDEHGKAMLDAYFHKLAQYIALPKKQKKEMEAAFLQAIKYYTDVGVPLETALSRIAPQKLGGFYAQPPLRWYPLDNAAKIYPLSMKYGRMAVFRLSVYLKEDIVPELLQIALSFTIKRFPSFATTVKQGFFWHYLDAAKRHFTIEMESGVPCKPLRIHASGSQSFRVLYYKNKISAEFFHALTDGTGGLIFLKTLTAEYLRLLGNTIPTVNGVLDTDDTPSEVEMNDDFLKADLRQKNSGFMLGKAAQMSGRLSRFGLCQVLHFELDADKLKAVAKSRNATMTTLVVALMFLAGKFATEEASGAIQIQVPVNMRKFYGSNTVRNFSMYCCISLSLEKITTLDDILGEIACQLAEKSAQSAMEDMMSTAVKLVRSIKLIPLFLKRPVVRTVHGILGDNAFTNTLSNIGVVSMPKEMEPFIEKFDFVLGGDTVNRASCTMITHKNAAVFSITKWTADPSFEDKMYRLFVDCGLRPNVTGSVLYEG